MGEFLPYLTVSTTYEWSDIAKEVLQEVLTRNVLWSIKKFRQLNQERIGHVIVKGERY